MVTEAGKELLRNTINTAKFHNKILEENEMWKQWELECGLTMMVSDDDIIKRIKKNHQCSKHHRRDKSRSREKSLSRDKSESRDKSRGRDKSRSRDCSHSKYERTKIRQGAGSSDDRWDHSGFAELYPDADVPDKFPSTSCSSLDKSRKKKKKSHHRSNSSDKEIWEEFKRPDEIWNKETTLRMIELLRDAPALWNINYPGYRYQHLKLREIKRIASEFHVDELEIMAQIEFLIKKFHKEHKKIELNSKEACAKISENEWFAYKHLTFLKNNHVERCSKSVKNDCATDKNPQWIDSSDSYSESEDDTPPPTANQLGPLIKSKVPEEKSDQRSEKEPRARLPYLEAYMAHKDSFSVYGEIVAHRLRESNKSYKAIAKAEKKIDLILHDFEAGFFDSPEDTFK